MPHAFFLGAQIAFVVGIRRCLNGYILRNLQSVGFQSDTLHWVVGQEAHFVYTQFAEDLGTYAVVSLVSQMPQADVGIHGVHAVFLEFVGFHLLHQADTASFLVQVDHYALAFGLNHLHGLVQLFATVTSLGGKDVSRGT